MNPGLCPDFPVYVSDWLSSTRIALMTPAEEGGYFRLLCHAWADPACTLPADDESLAALSRLGAAWSGSAAKIRACFQDDPERPGRIYNAKQREVRRQQEIRIIAAHEKCEAMRRAKKLKEASKANIREPYKGSDEETSEDESKGLSSPVSPVLSLSEPPSLADVVAYAGVIGLPEWKAVDWWQTMEGCGWMVSKGRPVKAWQRLVDRQKTFWEADGRPMSPPTRNHGTNRNNSQQGNDRSAGTFNAGKASQYRNVGKVGEV